MMLLEVSVMVQMAVANKTSMETELPKKVRSVLRLFLSRVAPVLSTN
jgi:hypothetical protein